MKRLQYLLLSLALASSAASQQEELLSATGKVTFLRVHDAGGGFGPNDDKIDGEVVIRLSTQQGKAFGFTLRNDKDRPAHHGMLDLLRDAFENDYDVEIDYLLRQGKRNGRIIRLALKK